MSTVDILEALKKRDRGVVLSECEQEAVDRADEIDSFLGSQVFFVEHNRLIMAALKEVLARLPQDAFEAMRFGVFIVFPEKHANYTALLFRDTFPPSFSLVVLADYLNGRDVPTVVGVIAHEFAHAALQHDNSGPERESAADALAIQWGFKAEITASVSAGIANQLEPGRRPITP